MPLWFLRYDRLVRHPERADNLAQYQLAVLHQADELIPVWPSDQMQLGARLAMRPSPREVAPLLDLCKELRALSLYAMFS
jgi:hypothetical protein